MTTKHVRTPDEALHSARWEQACGASGSITEREHGGVIQGLTVHDARVGTALECAGRKACPKKIRYFTPQL